MRYGAGRRREAPLVSRLDYGTYPQKIKVVSADMCPQVAER